MKLKNKLAFTDKVAPILLGGQNIIKEGNYPALMKGIPMGAGYYNPYWGNSLQAESPIVIPGWSTDGTVGSSASLLHSANGKIIKQYLLPPGAVAPSPEGGYPHDSGGPWLVGKMSYPAQRNIWQQIGLSSEKEPQGFYSPLIDAGTALHKWISETTGLNAKIEEGSTHFIPKNVSQSDPNPPESHLHYFVDTNSTAFEGYKEVKAMLVIGDYMNEHELYSLDISDKSGLVSAHLTLPGVATQYLHDPALKPKIQFYFSYGGQHVNFIERKP